MLLLPENKAQFSQRQPRSFNIPSHRDCKELITQIPNSFQLVHQARPVGSLIKPRLSFISVTPGNDTRTRRTISDQRNKEFQGARPDQLAKDICATSTGAIASDAPAMPNLGKCTLEMAFATIDFARMRVFTGYYMRIKKFAYLRLLI